MRLGGELDGAEQAVQSPEILVFQPRGARIFVAGDGERMLGFGGIGGVAIAVSQRFRHIEFARRESVLAVTHERAVKPYVDRGGGTVEGEADRAVVFQRARKLRVERESTAVDRHMVVFRNIWRLRILVTVPRILDVDVLVLEIAGHLQVARHLDRAEIAILEIDGRERSAFHVHVARLFDTNLPFAVEALLRPMTYRWLECAGLRFAANTVGSVSQLALAVVACTIASSAVSAILHPPVLLGVTASLRLRRAMLHDRLVMNFTNYR